jgi:hypothetical protein
MDTKSVLARPEKETQARTFCRTISHFFIENNVVLQIGFGTRREIEQRNMV